jgi:hypothetical protein
MLAALTNFDSSHTRPVRVALQLNSPAKPGRCARYEQFIGVRFGSAWTRARPNDGPDMLAAQRRGQPAPHQAVHDLHALCRGEFSQLA